MTFRERVAAATVREFGLECTWQEFDAFASGSGLSGPEAARKMKRLLKAQKLAAS